MKPFAIERDALDRLVARMLYEITEEGDTTVLREVLAGQMAIVSDLQRRVELLKERNALLEEYHAAAERFFRVFKPEAFHDEATYIAVIHAREALAGRPDV